MVGINGHLLKNTMPPLRPHFQLPHLQSSIAFPPKPFSILPSPSLPSFTPPLCLQSSMNGGLDGSRPYRPPVSSANKSPETNAAPPAARKMLFPGQAAAAAAAASSGGVQPPPTTDSWDNEPVAVRIGRSWWLRCCFGQGEVERPAGR